MDRRRFLLCTAAVPVLGLAKICPGSTGFPTIDDCLKGSEGLRRGEVNSWIGSCRSGTFVAPNGQEYPYRNGRELRALETEWMDWEVYQDKDIPDLHALYRWYDKPDHYDWYTDPKSGCLSDDTDLGRWLLVWSPSLVQYWAVETAKYDTMTIVRWFYAKQRDKLTPSEFLMDASLVEIVALNCFAERGILQHRNYLENVEVLRDDWKKNFELARRDPKSLPWWEEFNLT